MPTPRDWKDFYAKERDALGRDGLHAQFDRAPALPGARAIVFPHTRLSASGHLIAAAADAVISSGAERVLAIGVLHGWNRDDRQRRRVYTSVECPDEFSLDNFRALLQLAALRADVLPPRLIERFPFMTGDDPWSLPGFDELVERAREGAMIVATADPVHHGVEYGWPMAACLSRESPAAREMAGRWITEPLEALGRRDYREFHALSLEVKSDFRDVGPVLRELFHEDDLTFQISDLELVDYGDVLKAAQPTWVAAPLITVT